MENATDLLFATYPSLSMLLVRLGAGVAFFAHGAPKVFGWFGGPGLKATIATGKGHGFEFNFVLLAMPLAVLVAGPGVLSIDRMLRPLGE